MDKSEHFLSYLLNILDKITQVESAVCTRTQHKYMIGLTKASQDTTKYELIVHKLY